MTNCRNCGTFLEASFCPVCGQRNVDLERPLPELLGEAVRETFDVDGRTVRTLLTLFRRPGMLTSEFLAGRRKLYTPPFRLYLVISLLFFVIAAWVVGRGMMLSEGQTLESDAPGQARFVSDDLPRLMFVLLPVFALLLKAAFRDRLYFDHLIHSLHLHSAAYVVLACLLPLEESANRSILALAIQFGLLGYLLASFMISLRRVYRVSWRAAGGKALAILLVYIILVAAAAEAASHLAGFGSGGMPFLTD
jgi:hypothetical protein